VQELQNSGYKPRMCILGSRKHLCSNNNIRSKPNRDACCAELISESRHRGCKYFNRYVESRVTMLSSTTFQVYCCLYPCICLLLLFTHNLNVSALFHFTSKRFETQFDGILLYLLFSFAYSFSRCFSCLTASF